jgi:acyl carrier protein
MSEQVSPGRKLLLEVLDESSLIREISAEADLIQAGINSGDLIRLGLVIEERTHQPLSDDDLAEIQTVAGIDRVLTSRSQR